MARISLLHSEKYLGEIDVLHLPNVGDEMIIRLRPEALGAVGLIETFVITKIVHNVDITDGRYPAIAIHLIKKDMSWKPTKKK